jgi:hypothetical protein
MGIHHKCLWNCGRAGCDAPHRYRERRKQFNCSNDSNLCDHCGKPMCLHSVGDYYCPKAPVS